MEFFEYLGCDDQHGRSGERCCRREHNDRGVRERRERFTGLTVTTATLVLDRRDAPESLDCERPLRAVHRDGHL